jgi:hypothetical protein
MNKWVLRREAKRRLLDLGLPVDCVYADKQGVKVVAAPEILHQVPTRIAGLRIFKQRRLPSYTHEAILQVLSEIAERAEFLGELQIATELDSVCGILTDEA